ncbi:MAG: ATP-binding cassette domain-containing protein [Thermoleophilia bacterium]|nr:ATP-binding cassette domain-containing protein [Gaiellaceae bacterium]MDW8338112.1 ATP-binding cassette domain-containing protein [Thermoleophilia bacterium]
MTALSVSLRHQLGRFDLDVRFDAPSGLTVLFGPSGAGKSLTLSLVAGLRRPDAGRIELSGRTLFDSERGIDVATRERRVGFVFQDALLLPHRSVLDNVALAVRGRRSRSARRDLAHALLVEVGAAELARARPSTLSGGQRQRVALARALAGEPELLLLDEPLSALDDPTRERLRRLVRDVVGHHRVPALFVTHDREEASELADALVVLRSGKVEAVVSRDEVGGVLLTGDASRELDEARARIRELERALAASEGRPGDARPASELSSDDVHAFRHGSGRQLGSETKETQR